VSSPMSATWKQSHCLPEGTAEWVLEANNVDRLLKKNLDIFRKYLARNNKKFPQFWERIL
jgi:hypothetical protein